MKIDYRKRTEVEQKDGLVQIVDTEISVEVGPDKGPGPLEGIIASSDISPTDDINPLARLAVDTLEATLKVVK